MLEKSALTLFALKVNNFTKVLLRNTLEVQQLGLLVANGVHTANKLAALGIAYN